MNFLDQTVIVTGGGTGIGLEIVKAYLAEGANVVLSGRREETLKKSIKSLIKFKEKKLRYSNYVQVLLFYP